MLYYGDAGTPVPHRTTNNMAKYRSVEELHKADTLPCERCDGTGNRKDKDCPFCDGRGHFTRPDIGLLIGLVKGRKPGTLRSKRPDDSRAYYIWRMARFEGGADVTMPMVAGLEVAGDPYIPYLDKIADAVARKVYGTDRAGSYRWATAMGLQVREVSGLPASAYSGGPVADGDKPESELLELIG